MRHWHFGPLLGFSLMSLPLLSHAELGSARLDDLITQAVTTNPTALAARSEIEATRVEERIARLQRLPTPTVQTAFASGGTVTQLRIDQPLWTNGRITGGINQARYTGYAAKAFAEEQRYVVAGQVIDAWNLLIQSDHKINVATRTIGQLGKYEAMMQRRVDAGVSARIELDLIKSRILQSQVNREGAMALKRLAVGRLEQLIGDRISPQALANLPPLDNLAADAMARFDPNVIERMGTIGQWHPSVLKAMYQVDAAAEGVKIRRAERFPNLFLTYQHNYNAPSTSVDPANNGQFSLGLQYAPGAGLASWSSSAAASARLQGLEQSQELARRQVSDALQSSLQDFLGARGRAQSIQAASRGAQIVLESYERQFIAGRKSWLDVMNAVREIEQNAYSLTEAQTTLIASSYKIRLLTGQFPWQQRGIE